eukprot:scaffold38662_cov394-Skeletonema_dohrnii-CCMP3373.AAC.1
MEELRTRVPIQYNHFRPQNGLCFNCTALGLEQKQQAVEELESTISSLKQQIEAMRRRPSPRNGVSTSTTSRGNVGKENDENKAPASSLEQRKEPYQK